MSVFWELHLLSHFVGMFIRCSTPNWQKPDICLVYLEACFQSIRPRGAFRKMVGPHLWAFCFPKCLTSFFFMISNKYPPDIYQVSQNFQKHKKSCCSCSFELEVKLVFGFELVGGLATVAPAMAGSPHLSILDMAGPRCHSNTMVTTQWDPSRWQCEMETCCLHIHAKTKLFKLFLLSLDQLFFYWLCIARKC